MEYRHELKFLVTDNQLKLLAFRLSPFLKKDINQVEDFYLIKSLYFDNFNNSYLMENLNGEDRRSKYRIRVYDNSLNVIKLEKKSKVRGMTRKEAVNISEEECMQLMQGVIPIRESAENNKKLRMFTEMKVNGLKPCVIVEYARTAYVNKIGNVRITFDRNIKGATAKEFFSNTSKVYPVLPKGIHILEVKYDEFLPSYIYDLIDDGTLQQTAFSKYRYARDIVEGIYL